MPVPKKRTTSTREAAKVESSDHQMPDEQEFRHRMRNLAVSAMRILIEEVMREELEQCLGAEWRESTHSAQRVSQWLVHTRPGDQGRAH
jgi:putative transposase